MAHFYGSKLNSAIYKFIEFAFFNQSLSLYVSVCREKHFLSAQCCLRLYCFSVSICNKKKKRNIVKISVETSAHKYRPGCSVAQPKYTNLFVNFFMFHSGSSFSPQSNIKTPTIILLLPLLAQ